MSTVMSTASDRMPDGVSYITRSVVASTFHRKRHVPFMISPYAMVSFRSV
jgi:hypothetical protein